MILNKSQAEAIYSAACSLNNISARIDVFIESDRIHVREITDGRIIIHKSPEDLANHQSEEHPNQDAFAAAYSLNS